MPLRSRRKPRVFVTREISRSALKRLERAAQVLLWKGASPVPRDEFLLRLNDADAALSMVTERFDAATIRAYPGLRVISNLAVGVDNIDLEAATRLGVAVGHTPGILTETTADLCFALLMAAARRVAEGDRYVREGRWRTWDPKLMLGREVFGATLGIIGWGAIGRAVARRAAGFKMRVLYYSRPGTRAGRDLAVRGAIKVSLARLLAQSDFISLHVPLTGQTRHLLGAREFAKMRPGAIVVNTARGGVIDQRALAAALETGHLGAAGLDVADSEPIALDDPILKLPNVVITPHIGSASFATRQKMADLAVDNILDVFAGRRPRCCANPGVKLARRPED